MKTRVVYWIIVSILLLTLLVSISVISYKLISDQIDKNNYNSLVDNTVQNNFGKSFLYSCNTSWSFLLSIIMFHTLLIVHFDVVVCLVKNICIFDFVLNCNNTSQSFFYLSST